MIFHIQIYSVLLFFICSHAVSALEVVSIGESNSKNIAPLMGINVGPVPAGDDPDNADLTFEYQQLGINYIRNHDYYGPLDMVEMYPDTSADPTLASSYHFTESDSVYQAILEADAEPYFRLGNSYNNSTVPENIKNWVQASVEVIRHYRQLAIDNGKQLHYVEIWNEPDNTKFWQDDIETFYALFAKTYRALKTAFPDLAIGGSGFTPAGYATTKGQKIVQGLLDYLKEQNIQPDFISWHVYANDPQMYADSAKFYRNSLDAMGYQSTESHITEWNTDYRLTNDVALRTGVKGAAIIAASWIALQQQEVDVATFYRGTDPDINAPFFHGIYDAYGNPKPMAYNFMLFSKVIAYPEQLNITSDNTETALWLLAAKRDQQQAIFIVNPTDSAIQYRLAGNLQDMYTVEQIKQDGSGLEYIDYATEITILPYGSQLLLSATNSTTFSATATVEDNKLDLIGHISPKTEHIGTTQKVYAAVVYQGILLFLNSTGNWVIGDGVADVPFFQTMTLAEENNITLISDLPITGLEGINFFLGYGNDLNTVLNGQYDLIYSLMSSSNSN